MFCVVSEETRDVPNGSAIVYHGILLSSHVKQKKKKKKCLNSALLLCPKLMRSLSTKHTFLNLFPSFLSFSRFHLYFEPDVTFRVCTLPRTLFFVYLYRIIILCIPTPHFLAIQSVDIIILHFVTLPFKSMLF